MKAVILAAGRGSRLIPLTNIIPKPLLKVKGLSLITNSIRTLYEVGVREIAVIVGFQADRILQETSNLNLPDLKLEHIFCKEWERGNGISLFYSKDFVGKDDFILLMSDHILDKEILEKLLEIEKKEKDFVACIAHVKINPKTQNEYLKQVIEESTKILKNEKNEVLRFGKKLKDFNGIDIGAFLCKPKVFDALEELRKEKKEVTVTDCMNRLIEKGNRIIGCNVTGHFWKDVDTLEDINIIEHV